MKKVVFINSLIGILFAYCHGLQSNVTIVLVSDSDNDLYEVTAAKNSIDSYNSKFTFNVQLVRLADTSLIQILCRASLTNVAGVLDISKRGFEVDAAAQSLGSAYLSTSWANLASTSSAIFDPRNYIRAVTALMLRDNATRAGVVVFYESGFDLEEVLILPQEEFLQQAEVYLKTIPSSATERLLLMRSMQQIQASEFIVVAESKVASDLIKDGITVGLMDGIYHWFVVTRELQTFSCPECNSGSILLFLQQMIDPVQSLAVLSKVSETTNSLVPINKQVNVLETYDAAQVLVRIVEQLLLSNQSNIYSPLICFDGLINPQDVNANSRYEFANKELKNINYSGVINKIDYKNTSFNQFSYIDIYKVNFAGSSSKVGVWSSADGLQADYNSTKFTYLTKRKLRIVTIQEPPFVILLSNGSFDGYTIDILKHVAMKMNFDFSIELQSDGEYGVKLADGTWNGMIGALHRQEVDMAIGAITITAQRETVVDFSVTYYDYAGLQLVMKLRENTKRGDELFFVKAFTWEVWATIVTTILISGLIIYFMDRLSPYSFQNRYRKNKLRDGEGEGKIFTMKESLWFVLGAYTQAGESFDPRSLSTRIIVSGFWLFSYLMMAMYTSILAAQLTVEQLTTQPNSLEDLSVQTTYKYSVIKNTASYEYFSRLRDSEKQIYDYWLQLNSGSSSGEIDYSAQLATWKYPISEVYTTMMKRMEQWGFYSDTNDALNKVINQSWAAFIESPLVKYYANQICNLEVFGTPFALRPYGFAMQDNSPLVRDFDKAIFELQSERVVERLKTYWWSQNKVNCPSTDSSAGLDFDTLGGAFGLFGIGLVLSLVMLAIELFISSNFGTDWAKKHYCQDTVQSMGNPSIIDLNRRPSTLNLEPTNYIQHINCPLPHQVDTQDGCAGVVNQAAELK